MAYILNLVNEKESDIEYKKMTFADQQVSLKIKEKNLQVIQSEGADVEIISRFDSYEDLFYILDARDELWNYKIRNVRLFLTSVLTQRSDRRFDPDDDGFIQSFSLKNVTNILNAQKFDRITIFHPHSDVLPSLLDAGGTQCVVQTNEWLVRKAIRDIEKIHTERNVTIVSPDAGAYKWVGKLAQSVDRTVINANKVRDESGPHVVMNDNAQAKICLIVDDICDGGRTFIELAKLLREKGAAAVYLCVSHGLFTYGLTPLMGHIDHVYTTNSIGKEYATGVDETGMVLDFITRYKLV